jgi:hypothetical protein
LRTAPRPSAAPLLTVFFSISPKRVFGRFRRAQSVANCLGPSFRHVGHGPSAALRLSSPGSALRPIAGIAQRSPALLSW